MQGEVVEKGGQARTRSKVQIFLWVDGPSLDCGEASTMTSFLISSEQLDVETKN